MPKVKLHQNMLSTLTALDGQAKTEWVDQDTVGMFLVVHKTSPGKGTWCFRQKIDKRLRTFPLGKSEHMTLAEARKAVVILKAEIASGKHSTPDAPSKPVMPTLDDFFDLQYLPYIQVRNRSWSDALAIYNLRVRDSFGQLPLDKISRQDLESVHLGLKAKGLAGATCDHFIKLVRHVFNYAIQLEVTSHNPAGRIRLLKEDNRVERYLSPEELKRLMAVITARKKCAVSELILFLVSVGCRLSEGKNATFGMVDFHNRMFRIPASMSKSKKGRSVALGDVAFNLVKRLHDARPQPVDASEPIFRSYRTGRPLKYVHKVFESIVAAAKLDKHLRIHDLRHTHASMLAEQGFGLAVIRDQLGHAEISTTMRYLHLTQKSMVEASSSASKLIEAAMPKAA